MNQRHLALLALASASVCAVVFTACGGDDTNNADSGGNDATTDTVATDTSPPNDTGNNDTGGNDGGTDGATGDAGCVPGPGCQLCCDQKYPDAAAAFRANEETCACTNPGMCNTNQTCKNNLCNGGAATGGCPACLADKDAGDCRAKAVTACIADPSCQPLAACVAQCGIADAGGGG